MSSAATAQTTQTTQKRPLSTEEKTSTTPNKKQKVKTKDIIRDSTPAEMPTTPTSLLITAKEASENLQDWTITLDNPNATNLYFSVKYKGVKDVYIQCGDINGGLWSAKGALRYTTTPKKSFVPITDIYKTSVVPTATNGKRKGNLQFEQILFDSDQPGSHGYYMLTLTRHLRKLQLEAITAGYTNGKGEHTLFFPRDPIMHPTDEMYARFVETSCRNPLNDSNPQYPPSISFRVPLGVGTDENGRDFCQTDTAVMITGPDGKDVAMKPEDAILGLAAKAHYMTIFSINSMGFYNNKCSLIFRAEQVKKVVQKREGGGDGPRKHFTGGFIAADESTLNANDEDDF